MLPRRRFVIILSLMLLSVFMFSGCSKTKEDMKKTAEGTKAETEKRNITTTPEKDLSEKTSNEQQTTLDATEQQTTMAVTEPLVSEQPQSTPEPPTPSPTQSAPAQLQTQAQTPVPTQAQTPSPTQSQTPMPTQPQTPAPTQPQTPVPTQAQTPSPTQPQTPVPTQPQTPAPPQNSGASDFSKEAAMESLNFQNQKRAEAGLAPLSWNEELYQDVMIRGKEIKELFSHDRPDGSSCFSVVTVDWHTIGENIAYGYQSAQAVTEGWYNSQGHRENMLNGNFTSAAVVCYQDIYWVTMFIG